MKPTILALLLSICLIISASAGRPDPTSQGGGGYFGPGSGFNIPGFGPITGGGYGGGSSGGSSSHGVVRPVYTCTMKGPCYKKKLQCPAKCFTSYGGSGKGYGYGGGGGGCTMDCKKKCVAYC